MLDASIPRDQRLSAVAAKYVSMVAASGTPDDDVRLLVGMNTGLQAKRTAICARSVQRRRQRADQMFGSTAAVITKVRFSPNYTARYLLASGGRAGLLFIQDVRGVPIHQQGSKTAADDDDEADEE